MNFITEPLENQSPTDDNLSARPSPAPGQVPTTAGTILCDSPPPASGQEEMDAESAEKARPPAKRGALNTEIVFLDYLRGTVPSFFEEKLDNDTGELSQCANSTLYFLESLFGILTPMEGNNAKGYTHSARLACGGTVHWHETKPEQRVLINLGGQALAEHGQAPMELLRCLAAMGFQATRLDWARDDKDKLLDLAEIERKVLTGEMVTRFRGYGLNISGKIGDQGQQQGKTIYIGDRKSESFLRIYDKAAEQGHPEEHHIRVELEIKKRKAQKLLTDILTLYESGKDVGNHILGVFYGLIDFKEKSELDDNKSRWETCSWWSEFLTVSEKVKVMVEKSETTLERAKDWVYGQVGIVAGMIDEIEPGFLQKSAIAGKDRMKEHHRIKLNSWKAQALGNMTLEPG